MTTPLPILGPAEFDLKARTPEVFDHQVSGTYEECQRMAFYRHVWGRVPRGEGYALLWGRVFHKVVEVWLERQSLDEVISVIETNIPEVIEDRYGRDQRRMQDAFVEWMKYSKANPLEVISQEQTVDITCDSACPYSAVGCGLRYGGRMDRVVRWNSITGPLDIKTTVRETTDPVSEFRPDHQMEGYVWAASHLLGKHCWGAIIEQAVINKSKCLIRRFPIPFTKDMIKEWAETEKLRQAEFVQKAKEHPYDEIHWRQNFGRCTEPFLCPFKEVCLSPRDYGFRYKWLRDNTEEVRWDFQNPTDRPPETTALFLAEP